MAGQSCAGRFNFQSQFTQQPKIDIYRRVLCGQKFVAEKNRIRAGKKAERLAFPRNPGAPGGEADTRFRQRNSGDGNEADKLKNIN